MHLTLKSEHAMGPRSLFKHKKLILSVMRKAQLTFGVKVYSYAIAGNHLHLLIKGYTREDIQNFFRVFAGHTAQRILLECPLKPQPGGAPASTRKTQAGGAPQSPKAHAAKERKGCQKNQRKFWKFLIYSRVVTWGQEFKRVLAYIEKNLLETLHLIAYEPRIKKKKANSS